tara:strand:+ start:163 stop:903 length:741 start_codon:yes stop_codon:yes gene_type:complete
MKKVEVFNDNQSMGFGDLLNKLSFLFRTYQDDDVEFIVHDKLKAFNTFLLLKHFCFQKSNKKKILTNSKHFIRTESRFELNNHEYWPAKEQWESNTNGKIAINLYTDRCRNIFYQHYKVFSDYDITDIKKKYDTVELYGVDNHRGIRKEKIIPDKFECLEQNMNILKNCSLFVTSEGGMSHLSRSMGVPTILFFKIDSFNFHSFLKTFVVEHIQKLVHTQTELIDSIDSFIFNKRLITDIPFLSTI